MPRVNRVEIEKAKEIINREHWLTELATMIEPLFRGYKLGSYKVTCGWPTRGGVGLQKRVVGQCHGSHTSTGGYHELFISPVLDKVDDVAGTLCHEMAHVAAGVEAAHGPLFAKVCKHVGLTKGKPTQAMPGHMLNDILVKYAHKLGEYPHKAIVPAVKTVIKAKKDTTLVCPDCGCKIRISHKWLAVSGNPQCGCGIPMVELEEDKG